MPRSPRSSHGTNLCIEIGTLARCRRAEGTLHASESSLQRAGSPLHVQRIRPYRAGGSPPFLRTAKVGPNSLKFKNNQKLAQSGLERPPGQDLVHLGQSGPPFYV